MADPSWQIGGECFHIVDSYVWAEIQYLDSLTDYREFLPRPPVPQSTINYDLVMLDCSQSGNLRDWIPVSVVLFTPIIVIFLVLYFEL